jgi:hypothetical protein
MAQELETQQQFDACAEEVATAPGPAAAPSRCPGTRGARPG